MHRILKGFAWILFVLLITFIYFTFAWQRGELINARWIVLVSSLSLFLGYRYYSRFITFRVLKLNAKNKTPAHIFNDGLDFVPTHRYVLFGHHFAAIAGAGPLIGPVLAAQMGYLPGMIWLLVGAIFAGAVQDFIVLVISTRYRGRSLGELIKIELGWFSGLVAACSIFLIMVMLLAVLALIVIKALTNSPWSVFTVAATIPIGIFMGLSLRFFRVGKVIEISFLGFMLLIIAILLGKYIAGNDSYARWFTFTSQQLTWIIIIYGFFASVLPVWLLLAPRDYLSTFLKIGTIFALALAILWVGPQVKMPLLTQFIDGSGPVWSGNLFPFLFITIACGAVSGFHALISSGTTPKMIDNELDARFIGYGGMLLECFVGIMALIAASTLEPGVYFAINSPAAVIGNTPEIVANHVTQWGFPITASQLIETSQTIGEKTILSRTGGAPTLAIGMAQIFSKLFLNNSVLAFWYHFAILFEALFILTALDAGTRVGRFMLQDLIGTFIPSFKKTQNWLANIFATALCVGIWGYFLWQGVNDPLGGINTLWPLFGISNQMLAAIALSLGTVVLAKKNAQFIWVTLLPTVWLVLCTLTAGWQKLFSLDFKIGFITHAMQYKSALQNGVLLEPAKNISQMLQVLLNDRIDAILTGIFMLVVTYLFFAGIYTTWRTLVMQKQKETATVAIVVEES